MVILTVNKHNQNFLTVMQKLKKKLNKNNHVFFLSNLFRSLEKILAQFLPNI